jgi:adenylate cyclase
VIPAQLVRRLKQFASVIISLTIAATFVVIHVTIESGVFEHGPLSKKGLIHLLDLKSLDLKFQTRTLDDLPPPQVIIAAIDEKGVEQFGLWPWSRAVIGQFITAATAGGAKVIGFDAVFSDEDKNSSYANIKRFVNAYNQADLLPDGKLSRALADQVRDAEAAQAEAFAAMKTAGGGPGVAAARRALDKNQKTLAKARAALTDWQKRSGTFYQMMRAEVASVSPDEALARAVAGSPQTVLGYFNFLDERELVGVGLDEAKANVAVLDPVAVTQVYESTVQEVGGQEIDLVQPAAGVSVKNLWIREMIGSRTPLSVVAKQAKSFGHFNADPDPDGPMRRIRLFHRYGDKLYPALSLISAARFFDSDIRPLNGSIRPGQTIDGVASLNPSSGEDVPTEMRGHLLVNYYKNPVEYFPAYSVADFIDGSLPVEKYKDKVVLFGMTAIGLFDLRATPFAPNTPGVYIHAAAIQNMIDGRYLQRWYGLALIEAMAYLLLALVMGLVLPRIPVWSGILATLGFAIGLYFVDVGFVFPKGIWMLNVLPTLQVAVTFIGVSVYGFFTEGREKRQIRKAFQFYLTKSVVDEVLKDPTKLKLGGEKRVCTILFSDVRGFTTISERLSPEGLVTLLNSYLTPMTDIVYKYDGTLDKYIGDAIMAIFGAPVTYTDHAKRACYVCLEMLDKLRELQTGWRAQELPELDIGIGLNTGPVSAGNMGSSQRFDYTVMGDNVNLASRLEGINKQYGTNIIISESTFEAAKEHVHVREMDMVRVKGKKEPVKIFELMGKGKDAPPETAPIITTFHQGIAAYRGQKWDDAIALFEMVKTKHKPNDYGSEMYIERCLEMRKEPPGGDWDGVYTMTTK